MKPAWNVVVLEITALDSVSVSQNVYCKTQKNTKHVEVARKKEPHFCICGCGEGITIYDGIYTFSIYIQENNP